MTPFDDPILMATGTAMVSSRSGSILAAMEREKCSLEKKPTPDFFAWRDLIEIFARVAKTSAGHQFVN
jgi:hypothetical protein